MRNIPLVAVLCLLALPLLAEDTILVEAKVIEAPAGLKLTKADCESPAFLKKKGIGLMSRPRVLTTSGVPATVFVGRSVKVRIPESGERGTPPVGDGMELRILPTLDGDRIKFAASLTVRKLVHEDPTEGREVAEFSTREQFIAGECKSGEAMLVSSQAVHDQRRLHCYFVLSKAAGK